MANIDVLGTYIALRPMSFGVFGNIKSESVRAYRVVMVGAGVSSVVPDDNVLAHTLGSYSVRRNDVEFVLVKETAIIAKLTEET